MKLSCILVDDEPIGLELLESYVLKTPFLNLLGQCTSAVAATSIFNSTVPDLIIVNFQTLERSSINASEMFPAKSKVIFISTCHLYQLDEYSPNTIGYLLKPYSYSEFLSLANKVLQYHLLFTKSISEVTKAPKDCIFVKADYRLIQIELKRIIYIEGFREYLNIYLEGENKPITTYITMHALQEMLPSEQFLRVHRSFIVQTNKIVNVDSNRVFLSKSHVPISKSYKEAFHTSYEKRTTA